MFVINHAQTIYTEILTESVQEKRPRCFLLLLFGPFYLSQRMKVNDADVIRLKLIFRLKTREMDNLNRDGDDWCDTFGCACLGWQASHLPNGLRCAALGAELY